MKKISILISALFALLLLVGCGAAAQPAGEPDTQEPQQAAEPEQTEAAQEETPAEEATVQQTQQSIAGFDERLVGPWEYVEGKDEGSLSLYASFVDEVGTPCFFLYGGQLDTYEISFSRNVSLGLEQLTVTAADGEIDGQALLDYLVRRGALEESEAKKYKNLSVTYEFWDATGKNDDYKELYAADKEDGLTIHITADYQKDALSKETLDLTGRLRKSFGYRFEDFYEAYLYGAWADNAGNTWEFDFTGADPERASDAGEQVFVLKEPDGTEHKSGHLSVIARHGGESHELGFLTFYFEDFTSPTYKVESCTADSISLSSDSGDLVLTRK